MKAGWLMVALCLTTVGTTIAQTNYNDTVNCRWKDGRDMNARDCEFFRKLKASDEAEEAAHQARSQARLAKQREERAAQEQAKADRIAADKKEREERHEIEQQQKKTLAQQWAAEDARIEREEAKQEARRQAVQVDLKKRCGDDYRRPAVGLTIDRFSLCVAAVKATGQINRVDGVVTTYQGSGYVVHGMDGRVVAWTR